MSDTPESNMAILTVECDDSCCGIYVKNKLGEIVTTEIVSIDVLRKMERERNAYKAEYEEAKAERDAYRRERDAVQAELTMWRDGNIVREEDKKDYDCIKAERDALQSAVEYAKTELQLLAISIIENNADTTCDRIDRIVAQLASKKEV